MKCATCGKSESEDSQFCGSCGTRLGSDTSLGGEKLPMVGFLEAVRRGFKNYVNFKGRATRAEFLWWVLFMVGLTLPVSFVEGQLGSPAVLSTLVLIGLTLPYWAVLVRRLHDSNKSGWWIFLGLVPIGWIVVFIFMILPSDMTTNKYDPVPRQATS
jgi:uncharacterized membrane protein YhaH (DUF805 family)